MTSGNSNCFLDASDSPFALQFPAVRAVKGDCERVYSGQPWEAVMPPSHCHEFCLRTNMNWHSLCIAQHRIDSNYFVLFSCHFRISSQANTNVLKCSKHSYWPCESKPIRIASYCITERRINSCQFLLVRISSLYICINWLYIRTGIHRLSAATQYIAIRCAKIALSYWIAHVSSY